MNPHDGLANRCADVPTDENNETYEGAASPMAHSVPPEPPDDADLALLAASWTRLPTAVRAGILAMVRATAGPEGANAAEAAEGRSVTNE